MDKQTLSHYGWIVVLILVLSVMLAFATPFGDYVGNGVVSIARGFVGTGNTALSDDNIDNLGDKYDDMLNDRIRGDCGLEDHYVGDGRDHALAECGKHYKCDGKDHSLRQCGKHYACEPACDCLKPPCSIEGHYLGDGKDHVIGDCGKHYKCDGKDHSLRQCGKHYGCESCDCGWIVPEGCKYTSKNGTVWNAGEMIPNSYEMQTGDKFEDSDYNYTYRSYSGHIHYGWRPIVKSTSKTHYNMYMEYINKQPVDCLYYTYGQCKNLVDASNIKITKNIKCIEATFKYCSSLKTLADDWDTSNLQNATYTFVDCSAIETIPCENWDTSRVRSFLFFVSGCKKLKDFDMSNWDVSNVKSFQGMFKYCSALTSVSTKCINAPNVTDISNMFIGCSNMEQVDMILGDKIDWMDYAFAYSPKLTGTITINRTPSRYDNCFKGSTAPITIQGNCSSEVKQAMAASSTNGNITVK